MDDHSQRLLELEAKKKKLEEYRAKKASAKITGPPVVSVESASVASQTEDPPSLSQPGSPSSKGGGSPMRRRTHSRSVHGYLQYQQSHLSAEQRESMFERGDFKDFLDRSSKVMEIALNTSSKTSTDVLHDFVSDGEAAHHTAAEGGESNTLSLSGTRTHASVKGRPVMCLKQSAYRPEQLLSAYGAIDAGSTTNKINDEPLGVVCVWSELLPTRPEFTFHASSPVLSVMNHSLHPNLLVGTCYSGPLLIWDMRVRGKGAVKRSNPSAEGAHTHPVFSLCTTGNTESSHALLSGDLEGGLCCWRYSAERMSSPAASWSMRTTLAGPEGGGGGRGYFQSRMTMPAAPRTSGEAPGGADLLLGVPRAPDYLQSGTGEESGTSPLTLSCMGLGSAAYSTNSRSLYFGSTRGQLCRANWPIRDNHSFTWTSAHGAFLSALHCNPHPQRTFRDLLLTSSFDWTVKLWAPHQASSSASSDPAADESDASSLALPAKPLLEFRGGDCDYVSDVKWSPTNPSVFALASSGGLLSLYDLSQSTSEPWGRCNVISEALSSEYSSSSSSSSSRIPSGSNGSLGKRAPLNRVEWSSDGSRIICGDGQGTLYVVNVSKELTSCSPEGITRVEDFLTLRRNRLASEEANEAASKALGDADEPLAMGGSFDVDEL